jgi:hypothetical protein
MARRALVIPVVLAFLVGIAGSLGWLSTARAPDDRDGRLQSDATATASISSQPREPARSQPPPPEPPRPGSRDSRVRGAQPSLEIAISGTVDGVSESVHLSGFAHVKSTLVTDPHRGHPPAALLAVDLLDVSGVGLSTGARYVSSGDDNLIRQLAPSDQIDITFPFFPKEPGGVSLARSAVVSFDLSFDVGTGQVTGGTASLTTPDVPR